MAHPITLLQARLVAAWKADAQLVALVGEGVFDAPPEGALPPYLAIIRHDVLPRDGDEAQGFEHRLLLHAWADGPSRRKALALAERALAVALTSPLGGVGLAVTHRRHERTDTIIDERTGLGRAALALTFFTE